MFASDFHRLVEKERAQETGIPFQEKQNDWHISSINILLLILEKYTFNICACI